MDFINENENFFRTPSTNNLKNAKRAAFSSAKNKAKKVLSDVVNTIDQRDFELEDGAFAGKSCPDVEEMRQSFKSPKRIIREEVGLKNEFAAAEDHIFISCRCSSDSNDDFWKLPEELSLSKEEINIFATRWCNDAEFINENVVASSPIKFFSSFCDTFTTETLKISESYEDLLDESFEVVPPKIPF